MAVSAARVWIYFGLALFVSALCVLLTFWSWHPPVGVYIAILALLGVCVPLIREHIGKREKALWTIVMFSLVFLEIKSIYQDRNEFAAKETEARKEQLQGFKTIGDGIDAEIKQSSIQFSKTMSGINQEVDTVTGGQSFCYFVLANNGTIPTVVHQGTFPLYGVEARFVDASHPVMLTADSLNRSTYKVGDLTFQSSEIITGAVIPFDSDGSLEANIFFGARNGFWTELLRGKRINGQWVEAIRVMSPNNDKVLLEKVDKNYPRDAHGKVNWN